MDCTPVSSAALAVVASSSSTASASSSRTPSPTTNRAGRRELCRAPKADSLSSSSTSLTSTLPTSTQANAIARRVMSAALTNPLQSEVEAAAAASPQPDDTLPYDDDDDVVEGARIDIIARLPPELAVHIFTFVDHHTHLLEASAVSKTWRQYALHRLSWKSIFEQCAEQGWPISRDAERLWANARHAYGYAWQKRGSVMNRLQEAMETARGLGGADPFGDKLLVPAQGHVLAGAIDWFYLYKAQHFLKRRWNLSQGDKGEMEPEDAREYAESYGERALRNARRAVFWPSMRYLDHASDKRDDVVDDRKGLKAGHGDSIYCIRLDRTPYRLPKAITIDKHASGPLYDQSGSLGVGSRGRIFSGSRDWTIKIWDGDSGVCLHTLEAHKRSVLCMEMDDDILLSGSSDRTIIVWDLAPLRLRNEAPIARTILRGHKEAVLDLAMTQRYILSCGKDTTVRVYDRLQDYACVRVYTGHAGPVNAGDLSMYKGELHAATASGDGSIQLWNVATGKLVRVFEGHTKGLACVKYADDLLVTGSNDLTVRLWDALTGECLAVCVGHTDLVRSIAFDTQRKMIISAGYDGRVLLFNVAAFLAPDYVRTTDDPVRVQMWSDVTQRAMTPAARVFDVQADTTRIVSCGEDRRIYIRDYAVDSPIMRLFA